MWLGFQIFSKPHLGELANCCSMTKIKKEKNEYMRWSISLLQELRNIFKNHIGWKIDMIKLKTVFFSVWLQNT